MSVPLRGKDVFINCPFDDACKPIFHATLFAVYDLGFVARCALEVDDASEVRLERIMRIIGQCAYGVYGRQDQPAEIQHAARARAVSWV